ncbi:NAP1-related protein 2 [Porphyridium purpureum]|uniref:NAP1-related protein 2 n=1 Tax=Porphyridium purpureum TaxID=35688 RepID=A0A5J4Z6F1_PORPP|nr:NAP1-related protein 2 [Porphyridium purpureum]|eukprot:POR1166..scf295_1
MGQDKRRVVLDQLLQLDKQFAAVGAGLTGHAQAAHGGSGQVLKHGMRGAGADMMTRHDNTFSAERQLHALREPLYDARKALVALLDRFWLHVLLGHPHTQLLVMQDDVEPLAYLEHVSLSWVADPPRLHSAYSGRGAAPASVPASAARESCKGFSLQFHFAENEWFADKLLVKSFVRVNETQQVSSSAVQWRPGQSLVDGQDPSFFDWFLDEEDEFDLGLVFLHELIPNAIAYYLHAAQLSHTL